MNGLSQNNCHEKGVLVLKEGTSPFDVGGLWGSFWLWFLLCLRIKLCLGIPGLLLFVATKRWFLTKNRVVIWSSNPTPGHIARQKDTAAFTPALWTVKKAWNRPKCPSTDEWIKKMRCIYAMECYLAIEKDEIMPFAATWVQLELTGVLQKGERQILYAITYMWTLRYDTNESVYKTDSWT